MSQQLLRAITNLGDTAVVLPLAALMVGGLWLYGSRLSAWLLLRSMLACLAVMAALKIVFISCGYGSAIGIESPSGHASIATFFYGAVGVMAWAGYRPAVGLIAWMSLASVIVLIAISRVALGFHTTQEVLVGMVVGGGCLWWFARPYLRVQHAAGQLSKIGLLLLPVLLVTYGVALPVEKVLRSWTPQFRAAVCPVG